ncbi:DUF2309 domain-containing protein [Frigoriglobus tundricola]|uniref:Probable inorganic carbon transporter subunit DabA n=1 Tax=Frigoriglobus tundricola TaxID=2774151 RepID=A0A6M5YFJ5_9BACT|nr:DUF2309 domain-containing protein [Frigoriglobus tundricola]QJW92777.1 hypothetical protein FTUN_0274 [Frigoriglobus tundricola]
MPADRSDTPDVGQDRLRHAIEHAAHLLPAQGPITVFIHHNTLHAFEHLSFDQAVRHAAEVFGCQPYLTEDRYRAALARGRIRLSELQAVLADDLGAWAAEPVGGLCSRSELRLAMLQSPVVTAPAVELNWFVAETDALKKVRPEASADARLMLIAETRRWVMRDLRGRNGATPAWARALLARFGEADIENWNEKTWEAFALESLWAVCQQGAAHAPPPPAEADPVRHRDLVLAVTGFDTDLAVNDLLVRFCAAYLDQGVAHWALPETDRGFFQSFCSLYRRGGGLPAPWLSGLSAELARLQDTGTTPLEVALLALAGLGVVEDEWDDFLSATFLALRGWAGMLRQVEERGDRVARPIRPGSLIEFVAIRLLLDRYAVADAARECLGFRGPLSTVRAHLRARLVRPAPQIEERAFPVFQLAQLFGWVPENLQRLSPSEWRSLLAEIEAFNALERRSIFHRAYERRFLAQTLDALALHASQKPAAPRFQVVTCLDEREESFRRHLEEVAPDCETFGAAGFFAVPIYYRGATDAHFVPLCPIVIVPNHWVREEPEEGLEGAHEFQQRAGWALGTLAHRVHTASRAVVLGALAALTGVVATVPLVARILFPRLTARVRVRLGRMLVRPTPRTRLRLERTEAAPGPECGRVGFTVDEMVASGERLLRDIGLTGGFARIVFVIGHGSDSLNNPHKSAYDCGACGGSPGAPNARAFAQMMNDARVRAGLVGRGIVVPAETWFVGGYHGTCDDSVTFFDLDRVPETHRAELADHRWVFEATGARNAHERSRRFMSASLTQSFAEARRHVEGRSEDLAQTRPELGHATNAICVVGRRARTRGLFFDRRAFLTSYDPTQETPDAAILARTLSAVYPVCGGINLEYFFSHVDSPGYGCGTKLPHNITALLGVMDGAASDLRTGLPWQMVEIHEPVRLLIVCETTPEVMLGVMKQDTPVGKMIDSMTRNGWVQLAVLDPDSARIRLFERGEFREYRPTATALPTATSSLDWYRGWREHLEFAEIAPAQSRSPAPAHV